MRGKLMFITGLAAGFVLGSRAGREKYEEITANAKKVWEHPTVQEAAGVAQAQANKLYSEGKGKLDQSKIGQKLHSSTGTSGTSTGTSGTSTGTLGSSTGTSDSSLTATNDSLAGSNSNTTSTSTGTTY
jgi:hypothetical protein